jgi:hypothetical protein
MPFAMVAAPDRFAEYGFNYALGGTAARRSYVEQNPEITGKFVKAMKAKLPQRPEFTVDAVRLTAASPTAPLPGNLRPRSRMRPRLIRWLRRACTVDLPVNCRRRCER